jgi:hypothetical protein
MSGVFHAPKLAYMRKKTSFAVINHSNDRIHRLAAAVILLQNHPGNQLKDICKSV